MKDFEIRFKHSNSKFTLTETVTAQSYQYAREALRGRYDGLQILNYRQV
jgi:hypothetical protein